MAYSIFGSHPLGQMEKISKRGTYSIQLPWIVVGPGMAEWLLTPWTEASEKEVLKWSFFPNSSPIRWESSPTQQWAQEVGRVTVTMAVRWYGCPGLTMGAVLDVETLCGLVSLWLNAWWFCWPCSFPLCKVSINPEKECIPPRCTARLLPVYWGAEYVSEVQCLSVPNRLLCLQKHPRLHFSSRGL